MRLFKRLRTFGLSVAYEKRSGFHKDKEDIHR